MAKSTLTETERKAILESFNVDEKKLKEIRDTVIEWCSKEEHLKDAVPYLAKTSLVERQALVSSGSVEETKSRVDKLLRMRSILSDLCLNRELSQFNKILEYSHMVFMPKPMPKTLEKICVIQYYPVDDFDINMFYKLPFYILEHQFSEDMTMGVRYIFDMRNVTLAQMAKNTPTMHKKGMTFNNAHGIKIKSMHLLNASSFVDKILFIVKQLLEPKLFERLKVHPTVEDLHKHIPKEILPSDYKGDGPSVDELYKQWRVEMEKDETKKKMANLDKVVSDESKRLNTKFDEEQLGMPGSFKKLDLD